MFTVKKINSQYVHLEFGDETVVMMEGDILDIDCGKPRVIKMCKFCGREYDQDVYFKTMCEQCGPKRDPLYFNASITKYCGLYCSWLSDPDFCRRVISKDKLGEMKDDVAKRVTQYLKSKKKEV